MEDGEGEKIVVDVIVKSRMFVTLDIRGYPMSRVGCPRIGSLIHRYRWRSFCIPPVHHSDIGENPKLLYQTLKNQDEPTTNPEGDDFLLLPPSIVVY